MQNVAPAWSKSAEILCSDCTYRCNSEEFLAQHRKAYHDGQEYCLYLECQGSLTARNQYCDALERQGFHAIDCTGGQAAFEDGDFQRFCEIAISTARQLGDGCKLYRLLRIHDPGMSLSFYEWWIDAGVSTGIFQSCDLPADVKAE